MTRSNLTIRPAHLFLVLFSFQGSCLRLPHLTTCTVYYNFISESSTFLNYFSAHSVALTRRLIYNIRFYALWQPPSGSLFEILSAACQRQTNHNLFLNFILKIIDSRTQIRAAILGISCQQGLNDYCTFKTFFL